MAKRSTLARRAIADTRPVLEEPRPDALPTRVRTLPPPRRRAVGLSTAGLVAVALVVADVDGPVRAVVVAAALMVVPGYALLPRPGRLDGWSRAAATVALSLVAQTVPALVMVWTGWWHPLLVGCLLLVAGAVVIVAREITEDRSGLPPFRLPRPGRADVVPALTLALAFVVWVVGLRTADTTVLGSWGLLAAWPAAWFLGLALALGALLVLLLRGRLREGWLAAHLALVVLVFYSSATLVSPEPRLPWVYKHVAVTQYLELHGKVDPGIDIYNRWPGFFALTAQLAQMIGMPDPLDWARLAEPAFALLNVLLVLAVAGRLMSDRRWVWTVGVFYAVSNWVAQNYFAPQALGYVLHLFTALMLVSALTAEPRWLGRFAENLVARLLAGRAGRAAAPGRMVPTTTTPPAGRVWSVAAALAAFAVIVPSHQLTPYLALLSFAPLFVLGFLRPFWLAVGFAVLTIGFLLLNFDYIQSHFGVFSGFDPVANAVYTAVDRSTLLPGAVWQARGTQLISAVMLLTAAVGLVRRARTGQVRSAVVVGWLMVAPVAVLAGQSYGGEGRLRVYLFALPWISMAAAWALWPGGAAAVRRLRSVRTALVAVVLAVASLFTMVYFQPERDYRVAAADVAASEWIDSVVEPTDIFITTGPLFPLLVGSNYDKVNLGGDLSGFAQYYPDGLTVADVLQLVDGQVQPAPTRIFIVFSDAQTAYDAWHGTFPEGRLAQLETLVADDPGDQLVYDTGAARIYRLR